MILHFSVTSYCTGSFFLHAWKCSRAQFMKYSSKATTSFKEPHFNHPYLVVFPPKSESRTSKSFTSMASGSRLDPSEDDSSRRTRLIRLLQDLRTKISSRIKELRKGLSVKILFFLVGFYCSTAFATVIGQTGDWDILSAGLAVVVVEGIGALMYRTSFRLLNELRSLITMFNYWKAGLSLGLFLDAFKY